MNERGKLGAVTDTVLNGGKEINNYGCEGSQALPTHPSAKDRLK
jgi:hypothetical protein